MNLFNKFLAGIAILFLAMNLAGQKPIIVADKQIKFSHGEYPGFELTIPEVAFEDVSKSWIKKIEKGTKSKVTTNNGEFTIFGAQIDEIYSDPINIYSSLSSRDSLVLLNVTIELKPKEFVSRSQSIKEFNKAKTYLFEFGKEHYAEVAKEQLKTEEKKLKDLEKDLGSLQNNKTKLEESIVGEEKQIQENNDEIPILKEKAQNLNTQIGSENSVLVSLKDEEAIKEKEKYIKDLEKEKEKSLKEVENLQKKIVASNDAINRAKLEIETNLSDQSAKQAEIDLQKQVVNKAENKLNTILNY
jgi:DNA repair exonuclease SbcCD ATPase subunit